MSKKYRVTVIVQDGLEGTLEGEVEAENEEEAEQKAYELYKDSCRDVETIEEVDDDE